MVDCLEVRRRTLAAPRERTHDVRRHMADCPRCARFADGVGALDRALIKATRIPVPEVLNQRILLANGSSKARPNHRFIGAAAAALIMSVAAVAQLRTDEPPDAPALAAETVAQAHTAVSAISMVLDEEAVQPQRPRQLDPAVPAERLHKVGLALKDEEKGRVLARYVGRCNVAGRACEHVELLTYDGYVSVILMEDARPAQPVLVADRKRAALLSPAPRGVYIVVAQSPEAAKRAQRLFQRG